MITIMVAQVFLQASVLCVILYVVARYEADYSFPKVAMVTAGCVAGSAVLEALLAARIGLFTIVPVIAFVTFMIMTFCWVNLWKSILTVVVFMSVHVGFAMVAARIRDNVDRAVVAASPVTDEDRKLAIEFHQQVVHALGPDAPPTGAPPTEANPSIAPPPEKPDDQPSGNPWVNAEKALSISGIVTGPGGKRFAMIEGKLVEVGATVVKQHEGREFRWKVDAITRGKVDLKPLD